MSGSTPKTPKVPDAASQYNTASNAANDAFDKEGYRQTAVNYRNRVSNAQKAQDLLKQWEEQLNYRKGVAQQQVTRDLLNAGISQDELTPLLEQQFGDIQQNLGDPLLQQLKSTDFSAADVATPTRVNKKGKTVIAKKQAQKMLDQAIKQGAYLSDRQKREFLHGKGINSYLLDPTKNKGISDYYTPENVKLLSDPASVYDPNNLENAIKSLYETNVRNSFNKQLNAPGNFDEQLTSKFGQTADDSIINEILGSQFDTAKGALDTSLKSGQLNDIGYQAALQNLSQQKDTQFANLNTMGSDLLTNYKTQLSDQYNALRNKANSYTLGNAKPDLTSSLNDLNQQESTYLSGLKGSLLGKLGTAPIFDTTAAIQAGGNKQGIADPMKSQQFNFATLGGQPTGDSPQSILGNAIKRRNQYLSLNRGVGTGGAF